jgi:ABC-type uncharacterized transport system permease subunit
MSDVGEHIVTEPEEEEVASAALQRSKFGIRGEVVALYAGSLFIALAIAAICVAGTGGSWTKVYTAMLDGSIRAHGRWGLTLGVSTPILLVALGTIVNGRAGLVNIGQEGQLVMGASFAAYLAARLGGPGPFVLLMAMAFGVVGGALWAGIAGVLRYYRNVPEVLSTLLMGTIAANLMGYGLRNRWLLLAPPEGRANRNQVSKPLAANQRIPRLTILGNEFPVSVFAAIGLAVLAWLVLDRSVVGFRLRMLGRNTRTARRSGVAERRYGIGAMLVSGGFAGLAGSFMLAGGDFGNYQLVADFGAGIGFAGLLAALVARQRVFVLIFVAFVFGSMRTGSGYLRATGVSGRIADVVQGLLVLALLLPPAILYVRERRRALAATSSRV